MITTSNHFLFNNRYNQEQEQEGTEESTSVVEMKKENISDQMTMTSRIEAVEQKLLKLQSLKDETLNEFSSLLTECKPLIFLKANVFTFVVQDLVPVLNQLHPMNTTEEYSSHENESGLSKLLHRLHQLQHEYQKRRSVSEKRFNYRIEAVKERYNAELLHNKNESESEMAETSVALIHRHMTKGSTSTVKSSDTTNGKNGVISARKRSLPAINQPVTACPPAIKMARRQSVAAYPQNATAPEIILSTPNNRELVNSSILNLNQNILVTPKSEADADLLAIKSRISKALKR